METILELLSGGLLLPIVLLVGLALAAFGLFHNWSSAAMRERIESLKEVAMRVASLRDASANLALGVHRFDSGVRVRFESLEGSINRLDCAVGEVRRETHFCEKQVDKLESKAETTAHKVEAVAQQVHAETLELKRIEEKIGENSSKIKRYAQQIEGLEREVRSLELKRVSYQVKNSMGLVSANSRQIDLIERNVQTLNGMGNSHKVDLKRIDSEVKKSLEKVHHNALQITHLEREVHVLEDGYDEHKSGHFERKNSVFKGHGKIDTELKGAYRKIEKLMDETISLEIGCQMIYSSERQSMSMAQENDEHYRKLIEQAEEIFGDVRKYFPPAIVQCMELESDQLEWCRAELFANTANAEAARAYHQQVKVYLIKLKESISKGLHAIA